MAETGGFGDAGPEGQRVERAMAALLNECSRLIALCAARSAGRRAYVAAAAESGSSRSVAKRHIAIVSPLCRPGNRASPRILRNAPIWRLRLLLPFPRRSAPSSSLCYVDDSGPRRPSSRAINQLQRAQTGRPPPAAVTPEDAPALSHTGASQADSVVAPPARIVNRRVDNRRAACQSPMPCTAGPLHTPQLPC